MNPFKQKTIEKFTIDDCEQYLKKYPYGERSSEVRRLLRKLKQPDKNQTIAIIVDSLVQHIGEKQDKTVIPNDKSLSEPPQETTQKPESQNGNDDILKTVFAWIGIIVVVAIVGTILILLLDAIIPSEWGTWFRKHRYFIYPIVFLINKWLQDK